MSFKNLGLSQEILNFNSEAGLKSATEIQKKAVPLLLKGKDTLAVAPTGTGKTLAFALPIMDAVKQAESEEKREKRMSPFAIVLSPTRELAKQIHDQFKKISYHQKLRVRLSTGAKITNEYKKLMSSEFEILVSTPSRVKMAIDKGHMNLDHCKYCVLDEADQLFDMGFAKELSTLLENLNKKCTMGLFSATVSEGMVGFIEEKFPTINWNKVLVGREGFISKRIESFQIHTSEKDKPKFLVQMLKDRVSGRGIIFCNNKTRVETIYKELKEKLPKLKVNLLHGELHGKEREKVYKAFNDGKIQVLVATDLAARGIDIKDLAWVMNYELPKNFVYYVHRCGRVARGKNSGVIFNFISAVDEKKVLQINKTIREQGNIDIDLIKSKKAATAKKAKPKKVKETKRNKHLMKGKSATLKARSNKVSKKKKANLEKRQTKKAKR